MTSHPPPSAVKIERRANGELLLSCPIPPATVGANMVQVLVDRASQYPNRPLIAEQDSNGDWIYLTYGEAVAACRRISQWLLDHGAGIDRPLVILSPRSRQHFLMAWGAQMAGVPYCPVSVAYSTVPGAYTKLDWVLAQVRPAFVYVQDLGPHRDGLQSVTAGSAGGRALADAVLITSDGEAGTVAFAELDSAEPTPIVDEVMASIDGDTITRYMFTSGSTGMPKAVIQTHAMHMAFIAAMEATSPSEPDAEVRVLDWMPWSHTGSGVMRLNMIINSGGTVYLDSGRPQPGHFDSTVASLPIVRPTTYSGSPLGWSMLVDALEANDELAAIFFANAESFGFGAAAMPEALAARIQRLAERHRGAPLLLTTSLLSTEVSVGLSRWWPTLDHEVLGLPGPGADIKLVPVDDNRYEIRPRGLGVTPGYLGDHTTTSSAFDDEGFFRMGDAVRFVDPAEPERGLCFAGRVSEDFKLTSGTWVEAGTLRSLVITASSPLVRDAVICGLNEAEVTALLWPNMEHCQPLAGQAHPAHSITVGKAIATSLSVHNTHNPASSTRIARFLLLEEPPNPAANEITEKGYINQRAVQDHRKADVARLYAKDDPDVVALPL